MSRPSEVLALMFESIWRLLDGAPLAGMPCGEGASLREDEMGPRRFVCER